MSTNKLMRKSAIAIFSIIAITAITIVAYAAENESKQNIVEVKVEATPVSEKTIVVVTKEPQIVEDNIINVSSYISSNEVLTEEEKQINAEYIYHYLSRWGWADNAIFALLGNADHESYLNPGKWQNGCSNNGKYGFGIVQWTPAKKKILAWANELGYDPSSLYTQLLYINEQATNGEEWITHKKHNQSYQEFYKDNTHDVEWLCGSYYYNFERAGDKSLSSRVKAAKKWEAYFAKKQVNNDSNIRVCNLNN